MDMIIFLLDENGNRIQEKPNFYGEYVEGNSDGNIWMHIYDENKKEVYLSRKTRIYCSGGDVYGPYNYIIREACMGTYRVEEIM